MSFDSQYKKEKKERDRQQDQIRVKYGDEYIQALQKQYCGSCTFGHSTGEGEFDCNRLLLPIGIKGGICLYHSGIKVEK